MVTHHRRAFSALSPVTAGGIATCGGRDSKAAFGVGAGQDIVLINGIATAANGLTFFGQCRLLIQVVVAVEFIHVSRHHDPFNILPGAFADSITGVDGWAISRRCCAEIGAPNFTTGTGAIGQGLAVLIRTGEPPSSAPLPGFTLVRKKLSEFC